MLIYKVKELQKKFEDINKLIFEKQQQKNTLDQELRELEMDLVRINAQYQLLAELGQESGELAIVNNQLVENKKSE
mgnify:CR=1 FL=1